MYRRIKQRVMEGSPVPFTTAISNHGRDKNCNATIPTTDNTHQEVAQQAVPPPSTQGLYSLLYYNSISLCYYAIN